MKNRNIFVVFILNILTLGLYYIFWLEDTKRDMVKKGADIPSTWLVLIPVIYLWYLWKWSVAAKQVTNRLNPFVISLIMHFLWIIGPSIMQQLFNSVDDRPIAPNQPIDPAGSSVSNLGYPTQAMPESGIVNTPNTGPSQPPTVSDIAKPGGEDKSSQQL